MATKHRKYNTVTSHCFSFSLLSEQEEEYIDNSPPSAVSTSFEVIHEDDTVHEEVEIVNSHHTVPMPLGYEKDLAKRRTKFTKRSTTLLRLGKELHQITGAKVTIKIESNDGAKNTKNKQHRLQKTYNSCGLRSVVLQAVNSPIVNDSSDEDVDLTLGSPQKLEKKTESPKVNGLPGDSRKKRKIERPEAPTD